MKTGNAILAGFFFVLAFYVPLSVLSLIGQYEVISKYLPAGLNPLYLVLMISIDFLIAGISSLVFGWERIPKKKIEAAAVPIELKPKEPEPSRWKETKMRKWSWKKKRKEKPLITKKIQFSDHPPVIKRTPVLDRREFDERFP
jgi:hypothetical protein